MDYSSSGDDVVDNSSDSFDEPEMVDETVGDLEPEVFESAPENTDVGQSSTDQVPVDDQQSDDDGPRLPTVGGFETSHCPEAEEVEIRSIREWGGTNPEPLEETEIPENREEIDIETSDGPERGG